MNNKGSVIAKVFLLTIVVFAFSMGAVSATDRIEPLKKSIKVSVSDFGWDNSEPPVPADVDSRDPAEILASLEQALLAPRLAPPVLKGVALDAEAIAAPIVNLQTGIVYTDLQTAINAASAGDQLRIQRDLSVGLITIDRDLTIGGLTGQETLRATTSTGSSGDTRGWFVVATDVELHLHDLIIDGNGFSINQGIRHKGTGSVERIDFTDIQYQPSGPAYDGRAIAVGVSRVDVRDCTFDTIGRVGVGYYGSGITGVIFERNTYVGKGDGDFLDYGLELNGGASVAAWGNSFINCRGIASADGFDSAGIVATTASAAGTTLLVRGNTVLANTIGVATGYYDGDPDTTTATLNFNRLFGNEFGVLNASTAVIDAEHNWWGCNGGPGSAGCETNDIVTGSGASVVDSDPWLVLRLTAQFSTDLSGCLTRLVADLIMDADATDTSFLGNVPNGIPVTFDGGDLATAQPEVVGTFGGIAQTNLVEGGIPGITEASALVDEQTVSVWVGVGFALFCDGFESGNTSMWSLTLN